MTRTDVAVLGSGFVGSVIAIALQRAGFSVRVIDRTEHPKFALGESTFPAHRFWLRYLAQRWDIPELENLVNSEVVNRTVAATSGLKHSFGFVYHREGNAAPENGWMHPIAGGSRELGEAHWFRQDVDAYLHHVAVSSGVEATMGTPITGLAIDGDGVRLQSPRGTFEADFVVDTSAFNSVLCKSLGLMDDPTPLRTTSRCLFTHMIGVQPYDDVCGDFKRSVYPWHRGTLHHCFDGGWVWVIPFNNTPASRNPLVSVGVMFDTSKYPKPEGLSGAQEWSAFLERFPSIAAQFRGARPVRSWVSTDRLQFSVKQTAGPRYWVSGAASYSIDALYSHGLPSALQLTAAALDPIVDTLRARDWNNDRFHAVETLRLHLQRVQDQLVYGSYRSMKEPETLGAFLTLWTCMTQYADWIPLRLLRHLEAAKDPRTARPLHEPYDRVMRETLDASVAVAERVHRGELSAEASVPVILELLDRWIEDPVNDFIGVSAARILAENETEVFGQEFGKRQRVMQLLGDVVPEARAQVTSFLQRLFDEVDRARSHDGGDAAPSKKTSV